MICYSYGYLSVGVGTCSAASSADLYQILVRLIINTVRQDFVAKIGLYGKKKKNSVDNNIDFWFECDFLLPVPGFTDMSMYTVISTGGSWPGIKRQICPCLDHLDNATCIFVG